MRHKTCVADGRIMGRNKYPEETVAKILDAALELFCAQGYEGTSIQDIVDRLDGMTKGAVYHHFKSKEEIFNAAFDRAMTPIVEHRRSMLGVGNMTGAQKLKRLYAPESVVPQIELWARMRPAADPVKSSRLLAMQYQGSFDESADGCLLPVIEGDCSKSDNAQNFRSHFIIIFRDLSFYY